MTKSFVTRGVSYLCRLPVWNFFFFLRKSQWLLKGSFGDAYVDRQRKMFILWILPKAVYNIMCFVKSHTIKKMKKKNPMSTSLFCVDKEDLLSVRLPSKACYESVNRI